MDAGSEPSGLLSQDDTGGLLPELSDVDGIIPEIGEGEGWEEESPCRESQECSELAILSKPGLHADEQNSALAAYVLMLKEVQVYSRNNNYATR